MVWEVLVLILSTIANDNHDLVRNKMNKFVKVTTSYIKRRNCFNLGDVFKVLDAGLSDEE